MKPTLELMFSAKDAARIRTIVPPANVERRTPRVGFVIGAVCVVAVLIFLSWLILAQAADVSGKEVGTWEGVTKRDRVAVVLKRELSKDARLTFGGPRFCSLTARYESGRKDYALRTSNGGYCDRLLGGRMKIVSRAADDSHLDLEVSDDKGVVRDTAALALAR
jgi:hypothetical protein